VRRGLYAFSCVFLTLLVASCSSSVDAPSSNPASPSPPTSSSASPTLEADLVFCVTETNQYRATLGLAPLTRSGALEAYAAVGAREDGLAHVGHQHFRATNGGGIARAENEIPWWGGSSVHRVIEQGLSLMWAEGPGGGHFENMRGPYREVGCGVFVNGGEITVVQNLR
jgi:uncharacterized protein YkwD